MIKWSATRINVANYCRMRYYLTYEAPDRDKSLRLSAYVRGSLLHQLIERFWINMGTPEEVARKSLKKKYSDAEGFARYARGKWQSIIMADERLREKHEQEKDPAKAEKIKDNLIYWRDESQKYVIMNNLPKVCIPLFNHLKEEGPPIATELPFDFIYGNRRFTGKIDEIRRRNGSIIIRDYKSGKPWVGEMKLEFDPQLTMYNFGLCSICFSDRAFAERLGLEERVTNKFLGNPIFINPDFKVEFFMIDALGIDPNSPKIHTVPQPIVCSERRDEHFFELMKMIYGTEESMKTGNVYPERGRKCDDCDRKEECRRRLENAGKGEFTDSSGQEYFSFVLPAFMQKQELPAIKQKRIRFDRPKPIESSPASPAITT